MLQKSQGPVYVHRRHMQMRTQTHMHAVQQLSAMVDDLTFSIIQMPLGKALISGQDRGQDTCQRRGYTERKEARL